MTARSEDLFRIEAEVGVLIRRIKRVIAERAREVHPQLHPMTYPLLAHIVSSGPLRAADLCDTFSMDKGGVSRQVQSLVDLGLVDREPDPEDRRATLLVATAGAKRGIAAVSRRRSDRFAERLSGWSEVDLAAFADQLGHYNAALSGE